MSFRSNQVRRQQVIEIAAYRVPIAPVRQQIEHDAERLSWPSLRRKYHETPANELFAIVQADYRQAKKAQRMLRAIERMAA